jgi:hypothetical protein
LVVSHEFIEFYNTGPDTVNLLNYYLKTGSTNSPGSIDSNNFRVWPVDTLGHIGRDSALKYDFLVPPSNYAVILCRKYAQAPESTWYSIRSGTYIFAPRKTYIRSSGMPTSVAFVELYNSDNILVSSFNSFGDSMKIDTNLTWHLVHSDSQDVSMNWLKAYPTPGDRYPYDISRKYSSTLIVNEFMCDPAPGGAEWVEVYNHGSDTVNLNGWRARVGDEEADIILAPLLIAPDGYALIKQPGEFNDSHFDDALCHVAEPYDWDMLSRNDDYIVIKDNTGKIVDSLHYQDEWFGINKGVSVERLSADRPANESSNWKHSTHASNATPGFANSSINKSSGRFTFRIGNRIFVPGSKDSLARLNIYIEGTYNGTLTLKIYDIKGRPVKTFYDRETGINTRYLIWDGRNRNGRLVGVGAYVVYCEFKGYGRTEVRKIPVILAGK